jgi:hypothetical protein
MRTYVPDQWLRNWFVGGSDVVDYGQADQVQHRGPETFASELGRVWQNVRQVSKDSARLVIRFGGISDRRASPHEIIRESLSSGWRIQTLTPAGVATDGKRQANSFLREQSKPIEEFVVWAVPA